MECMLSRFVMVLVGVVWVFVSSFFGCLILVRVMTCDSCFLVSLIGWSFVAVYFVDRPLVSSEVCCAFSG